MRLRNRSGGKGRGMMHGLAFLVGKCCILWSFIGWKWLKKAMAFDFAGVVSKRLY